MLISDLTYLNVIKIPKKSVVQPVAKKPKSRPVEDEGQQEGPSHSVECVQWQSAAPPPSVLMGGQKALAAHQEAAGQMPKGVVLSRRV